MKFKAGRIFSDGCSRAVAGVFGAVFLMAFLIVPCTKTSSKTRPDPSGRLLYKTTISKNTYMFLPQYLSSKSRAGNGPEAPRMKSIQWMAVMGLVAVLGILDYFLFCSVLRRPGRGEEANEDEEPPPPSGPSGFSLLR